jgi:hypothetical protein
MGLVGKKWQREHLKSVASLREIVDALTTYMQPSRSYNAPTFSKKVAMQHIESIQSSASSHQIEGKERKSIDNETYDHLERLGYL